MSHFDDFLVSAMSFLESIAKSSSYGEEIPTYQSHM